MNVNSIKSFNNSLFRKIITLFFGRFLPTLTLVIITIVFSRQLNYNDYGSYQWILMYMNIAAIILSFGLPSAILTIDFKLILQSVQIHLFKIFLVLFSIIIALSIILYTTDYVGGLGKTFCLVILLTQALISIRESILIKNGKENFILIVNLIYSLFFLVWHLYQLKGVFNLNFLLFGLLVLQLLRLLILIKIKLDNSTSNLSASQNVISLHIFNLGVNDTLNVLTRWVDKLVLVYFITRQEFAIFFNGTFEIPFISLLVGSTGSIIAANIAEQINHPYRVAALFSDGFKILSNFIFPLFFFFLFFYDDFFLSLFSHKYQSSLPIFFISIMILPIRINSYTTILQCKFKSREIVIGSLLDLILALTLMLALYPLMGLKGVAIAVVISTYVQATYYMIRSAEALNLRISQLIPFQNILSKFVILFLLFFILYKSIDEIHIHNRLIISIGFTLISIILCCIFYFHSRKEKYK